MKKYAFALVTVALAAFVVSANAQNQPFVKGGQPADPREWPSLLAFVMPGTDPSLNVVCTATRIGPATIMTAAHCLAGGKTVALKRNGAASTPSFGTADCTLHPEWRFASPPARPGSGSGPDMALCKPSAQLSAVGTDRVSGDNYSLPSGPYNVVLVGFGCTDAGVIGTEIPYFGFATGIQQGADLISVSGGAYLCRGDSGGAAYNSPAPQTRVVIGINRSTNALAGTSIMHSISAPVAREWLRQWEAGGQNPICGITTTGNPCDYAPGTF